MIDDNELSKLKGKGGTPPRDEAREQAMAAAMEAFDALIEADAQKKPTATQGSRAGNRLISIATRTWRFVMDTRRITGPAIAALLIVPLGGYMTWKMMDTAPFRSVTADPDSGVLSQSANDAALNDAAKLSGEVKTEEDSELRASEPAPVGRLAVKQYDASPQGGSSALAMRKDAAPMQVEEIYRPMPTPAPGDLPGIEAENRDRLQGFDSNPVKSALESPVSTFSVDVDSASYAFVRRQLNEGRLPDPDTVRVEEMINYFTYDWPASDSADVPFRPTVTVVPSPWNAHRKLMHVAIKGFDIKPATRPKSNLVLLADTSGSMNAPDKLPLLKASFRLLLDQLGEDDIVSIVTYAGSAGTALEPTKATEKAKILAAIDALGASGSTAGAAGITQAYALAEQNFVKDGVNRVMLATDGDFNVGLSSDDELKQLIEDEREKGIFLSVFGFGEGNYNDQLMQVLAQNGNGTAAYIDTLAEAEKTLVQESTSTLFPIAKDVKIQVEFNPAMVAEYRLVGYETRALKREDFNNDHVDAGDVGSGHSVTAIYEITPTGSPARVIDDLRYGKPASETFAEGKGDEYAFLKLRYKLPDEDTSRLIETPVTKANETASLNDASNDVRFSVAVAGFGQKLRRQDNLAETSWAEIAALAARARGDDPYGYRAEFLRLVKLAGALSSGGK